MKTYLRLVALAGLALFMASCVQDLDTNPIDPNIVQTFNQDEIYYKIYAGLGTSGQKGPDGDCDIVANDEGYSVFYRLLFVHNEFATDGGWWIWNDAGIPDLQSCSWTSGNAFVKLLYTRLTFNVTVCNHFLENTEGKTDDKTIAQRAEIRFMRAMNYYYLMDFFGNPPFVERITIDNPTQMDKDQITGRKKLYKWIETELLAAEEDLGEKVSLYRVSKDAARMLLARLYLNAEVYTNGEVKAYDKAEIYAKKITDAYELAPKYAELFMGDNDKNSATPEIIFAIAQDGDMIQSWGASSAMVCMSRASNMNDWGSTDQWECFRSSPELIAVFTDTPDAIIGDETQIPSLVGDDRAIFCNKTTAGFTASCNGPAQYGTGNFNQCWAICKWTGMYSTGTWGKRTNFVDTDVPFLRAGEAYMTLAEALYRQDKKDDALAIINDKIRARAHAVALTDLTDDILLDEWHREFYSEGHRRIDLIRFGQFAGPKATRKWEGHKKSVDKKYNLYPIPVSDCVANPELEQIDGY